MLALVLALSVPAPAYPPPVADPLPPPVNARIVQLERELADVKARLSRLEGAAPVFAPAPQPLAFEAAPVTFAPQQCVGGVCGPASAPAQAGWYFGKNIGGTRRR